MPVEEKLHRYKKRFKFMSRRKSQSQGEYFRKDNGELSQMAIIIAGLTVAGIVVTGGISSVTQSKGKATAECINESTNFGQGATVQENCKKTEEEAQEDGEEAIVGNFGESSPIGGNEPDEEELITSTSDTCFVLNAQGDTITDYKIELEECTTDVAIPNSINNITITSIGGNAFSKKQLTSVVIPDSVTNIGSWAFSQNQLTSVSIPDSVTSIGYAAFQYNQLTSVVISNGVTTIGSEAFRNNNLTSVVIPDSVTNIGSYVFWNNNLTSVVIPDSVTIIYGGTFDNNQLTSVSIPDSVTSISSTAFRNNQLTSVIIPDSVTFIGPMSFWNNPLTSVSVPSHLTFNSNVFPTTTNITIRS